MHLAAVLSTNPSSYTLAILLFVVGVPLYWTPTFVALKRNVRGKGQVVVVNLFLGWTFLGWVVALVMAFREAQPRQMTPPAYQQRAPQPDR